MDNNEFTTSMYHLTKKYLFALICSYLKLYKHTRKYVITSFFLNKKTYSYMTCTGNQTPQREIRVRPSQLQHYIYSINQANSKDKFWKPIFSFASL